MRTAGRFILILLLLMLMLPGIAFFFAVDNEPSVHSDILLTHEDIQRVRQIIHFKPDVNSPMLKTLELTEKDLNIAANHILDRHVESSAKIVLYNSNLHVKFSIKLNNNLFDSFVNVRFDVYKKQGRAEIENFSIGQIAIPDRYAAKLVGLIIRYSALNKYYILAKQHIKKVQLRPDKLIITYSLDHDSYRRARSLVSYQADNEALKIYQRKLVEVIANHDKGWLLSLADIMRPLFHLAYQRSTLKNAIEENKTVIFIVSAYVNKNQWQQFLPDSLPELSAPLLPVYIYKRTDMAQHFMGSAALSSLGSSYMANLLGMKKELRDADGGGSGFSFIDLAADRAGAYFGRMATYSPHRARKLQKAMSNIDDYTAFMPDVRDLPEKINVEDLIKQFNSIDSPASKQILQQIDARIQACPVYNEI